MNSRMSLAVACFALRVMLIPVTAAAQRPQESRPDLGAPGEEHRRLDVLTGTWNVAVSFPVAPGRNAQGNATCEARWDLDGRFVRQEYQSTFGGKQLTIVRYVGFDRQKARFVEIQFESTHTDVMYNEGVYSPDTGTITTTGRHVDAATGQSVTVRSVTTFVDQDAFTVQLFYADAEGRVAKTITLTHTRSR